MQECYLISYYVLVVNQALHVAFQIVCFHHLSFDMCSSSNIQTVEKKNRSIIVTSSGKDVMQCNLLYVFSLVVQILFV